MTQCRDFGRAAKRYAMSLVLLGLVAVSRTPASPADVVLRAFPVRVEHVSIDYLAADVCADGAVWMVWSQNPSRPLDHTADTNDLGLFCRLVTPSGSDVVPPTRIVKPIIDGSTLRPAIPETFLLIAGPGGELFVFFNYPPPSFFGRSSPTSVVVVDRRGRVGKYSSEGRVPTMRENPGYLLVWSFWSRFDGDAGLRYICDLGWNRVRHATLRKGTPESQECSTQAVCYATEDGTDSALFAHSNSERIPWRRGLSWARRSWKCSDIAFLGGDTLLVASLQSADSSSELTIYRFRWCDLSLIDSARYDAETISGRFFAGVRAPRAILQETRSGYAFLVPTEEGSASYSLAARGDPVPGRRDLAKVGTFADYTGEGLQMISFLQPHGGRPAQVKWYGFSSTGVLHFESASR